ncbi:HlyD family secretion protein [Nonlabens xiamenensis]|uniref:HlyD family secretion protein n=1 Tax=Nonlabens xiamenensis TaxID=2341043 RepID=UPI000F60E37F|nr:HlyD family efflux transporter periplasmic adaptor subunit [Nonlabens xiamenensis]
MPENNENLELRSDEVQEIITRVPHFLLRYGSFSILLVIILGLGLSYLIEYPDLVPTQAIITTRDAPQKELAQVSTRLDSIYVTENGKVQEGDLLMILENNAAFQDVLLLERTLDTLSMDNENVTFPIYSMPILYLGDLEQDYAAFENAYLSYELNRKLKPFENNTQSQKFNRRELEIQLENLLSRKRNNLKELELKQEELRRMKTLFDKGVIARQEYESKQLDIFQYERSYQSFTSQISQLRNQLYNNSGTLKGIAIENEIANFTLRRSVNQAFINLKRSISNYKSTYLTYANRSGTISFPTNWEEGNFVQAGEELFTIFPENPEGYLAFCKTPALNFGKVKPGQRVNINMISYPEPEYGSLIGSVESMGSSTDDDGNYLVIVQLPENLITTYNKKIELSQEAIATAEIITEDLRLIDRFIYRFRELFDR